MMRHKKSDTAKHRQLMKKQRMKKNQRKAQREKERRRDLLRVYDLEGRSAHQVRSAGLERDIKLRRLHDLLVQRLNGQRISEAAKPPEVICQLCKLPITIGDTVGKNTVTIMANNRPVPVHRTCPTEVQK